LLNTSSKDLSTQDSVLRIQPDGLLQIYHQSIRSYLSLPQKPSGQLLLLKFEELLLSLFSNKEHQALTDYFISLCQSQQHQMSMVMEQNFGYNLTLENYARLCHMSLSTFKKCFKQYYNASPGAWLKMKRLALAVDYLLGTNSSVSQISFDCGFEDTSHFIRVFKEKYYLTPLQYRQKFSKLLLAGV